jgi:ATP-dependent DNA ligase
MDTRRESVETAENPAAVADAESNALQMIAGLRERVTAQIRAAGPMPLGAAVAALGLLGGWLILRRRGRRGGHRDRTHAAPQARRSDDGLPAWLEPELATLTRDRVLIPPGSSSAKLDGERCLAFVGGGEVRLMSRNEHNNTSTFPEVARALAAQRVGDDFIVDGEIVAFDGDETKFSLLQRRFGVIKPTAGLLAEVPAYYYMFDVLYAGGRDVRPLPLLERKPILRGLLSFDGPLRYTEHRDTEGEAYYRRRAPMAGKGSSPSAPTHPTAVGGPRTG